MKVECQVNGEPRMLDGAPLDRLLDVLRESLGRTVTQQRCRGGGCGDCPPLADRRRSGVSEVALQPSSLAQALRWLADDPTLVPVAGCTDLLVADALRRAAMARVLDVTRIAELRGLRSESSGLAIGATATFSEIADARVAERFPALAEAARQV